MFIKSQGEEILTTHEKISTVHFAAVCSTPRNLEILIEEGIDLHDEDKKKTTPLMWAIEARKSAKHIKVIMDDLTKGQKDFKDEEKKMAIHYVCQFGCEENETEEIMDLMMNHKAKFSQAAGWFKYTPLIYACVYGQLSVV